MKEMRVGMVKIKILMKTSIIVGILLLCIRGILVELGIISEYMRGFLIGAAGTFLVAGCILVIYYVVNNKDDIKRDKEKRNVGIFYGVAMIIFFGIKAVERFLWEVPDYVAIPLYVLAGFMAIISIIRYSNRNKESE